MSTPRKFDIRQSRFYGILQQILPFLTFQQMDTVMESVDADLTVPLRADATSLTGSLVVNVQPGIITNTYSNRSKSMSFINDELPTFNGGTVTFPSASGGNITTSTGGITLLTCPAGNYCQVLLSLDDSGDLLATAGGYSPTAVGATVPAPITDTLPFAYVTLYNNAGTIQNITQSTIFQLVGGGGSGAGGTTAGFAQQVPLTSGTTSVIVTFPSTLAGTGYVVTAQMTNPVDAHPEFQPIVITNKTVNGFTASWNAALDTSNYNLDYIVPAVQSQIAEVPVSLGVTSITVTLPIALSSTGYVVIAQLVDLTDAHPQFQPTTITAKTTTGFTATWNVPTDTANYKLAYNVAVYQ